MSMGPNTNFYYYPEYIGTFRSRHVKAVVYNVDAYCPVGMSHEISQQQLMSDVYVLWLENLHHFGNLPLPLSPGCDQWDLYDRDLRWNACDVVVVHIIAELCFSSSCLTNLAQLVVDFLLESSHWSQWEWTPPVSPASPSQSRV